MKKINWKAVAPYIVIPLAFVLFLTGYFMMGRTQKEHTTYYDMVAIFDSHEVAEYKLNLTNGNLKYKLKGESEDQKPHEYTVPNVSLFVEDVHQNLVKYNREHPDDKVQMDYVSGSPNSWWVSLLPTLGITLLLIIAMVIMFRKMNQSVQNENNRAMSFGKARYKKGADNEKKKTFADVAGADEEKEELEEIVEFLKNPQAFNALGARIPKGVLLVGPPGTGKTLLAKAVAGEADVPFFSISGSDFVEMYVGVGASRVRDLFKQAKENAPGIVFIDEIDAVGRQRGTGLGGGNDEREQTLNQLLVEMDGFERNEGVVIIAATNRQDVLDPALLRPGRFDRQIYVGLPDVHGREEILKVHVKNKPLADDVDLNVLARSTTGFAGADLENLANESALMAARNNEKVITMVDMREAMLKVIAGPEKKSRIIPEKERRLTAYHEAGHAIVMHVLPNCDPVHRITIIPRGGAGGMTISLPAEERSYISKSYLLDEIVALLGGRTAEKLILGDISTGASNDIQRASNMARKMVAVYGMSDKIGMISFESGQDEIFIGRSMAQQRTYSEKIAAEIDDEIKAIIDESSRRCEEILREHEDKLHMIAQYLLEHETMEAEEFEAVFDAAEQPVVKISKEESL